MKKWLSEFFSMSERKVSTLIICLVATIIFSFVMYTLNGDISSNLKDVLLALIFSIAGVNGLNIAKNFFSGVNSSEIVNTTKTNQEDGGSI